jgi:hypothetical protein
MRFTQNLLPLLRTASTSQPPLARIISVLGAGYEGALDRADLSLRKPGSYGLSAAANHATSMTSLSFQHLASDPANKGVAFIHSNPGGVETDLGRGLHRVLQTFASLAFMLLKPTGLVVGAKESGERHVWTGTSDSLAAGLSLVGPKGEKASGSTVLDGLKKEGMDATVWEHLEDVFKQTSSEQGRYEG